MTENTNKEFKQFNVYVLMFVLYGLDKELTDIWDSKWKKSKTWEEDFFNKLKSFTPEQINEAYNDFLDISSGDSSVVIDTKRNRYTDYGSKGEDISKIKQAFYNIEESRISKLNSEKGFNLENKVMVNSLIYPIDLAYIKLKTDSYGIEFELSETPVFQKNMFSILDKLKELDNLKEMQNVSIIKGKNLDLNIHDKKSFSEYYKENNNISKSEYIARYKKSYFFKKNGIDSLETIKNSNIQFTKDGAAIIPMYKIDELNKFNPENITSYQHIFEQKEGGHFKLFVGNSSEMCIKIDKTNLLDSNNNSPKKVYVAEGLATSLSIQEILDNKSDVICAFNADNLVKVVKNLVDKFDGKVEIIVCMDRDKPKLQFDNLNSFYPNGLSLGKGTRILEDIISQVGENKVFFSTPVFENNIDNSTVDIYLDSNFKKGAYSKDRDRSDYNDKNLDVVKSKIILENPYSLNNENMGNIQQVINVIKGDSEKQLSLSLKNINNLTNLIKREFLKDTMLSLENEENRTKFVKEFGDNSILKIIDLAKQNNVIISENLSNFRKNIDKENDKQLQERS